MVENYGLRLDNTPKGSGWLGPIEYTKDIEGKSFGFVSTELSINVDIDGKDTLIPLLVPTLSQNEINFLIYSNKSEPVPETIKQKAVNHALSQIKAGKSPFKEDTMADQFGGIEVESGMSKFPTTRFDEFGGIEEPKRPKRLDQPEVPFGKRLIEQYARPSLQAFGAAGGALIGTPLGPLGIVGGGGLGYAIGDEIADLFSQWWGYKESKPMLLELQESAEDIATGLAYEMGGQSLAPAAKLAGKGVMAIPGVRPVVKGAGIYAKSAYQRISDLIKSMPLSRKGTEKKAGEVMVAMTHKGPLIVDNIEKAQALEEAIPGLKFNLGQLTDDPGVIKYAEASSMSAGDLAVLQAERSATNSKAINEFIKKSKGPGTIEDVIDPLIREEKAISEAIETTSKTLEETTLAKKSIIDPMEGGVSIRTELEAGEKIARDKASELFDLVPDQNVKVDDLVKEFENILKKSYLDEAEKKIPDVLKRTVTRLKESVKLLESKDMNMTLKDLQGLRSEILEDLRTAIDKGYPRSLRARLGRAVEAIDKKLIKGGIGKELKTAQKYFKEEVIGKYHKGSVGDIMSGPDAVQDAMISGKFFKSGPAGEQAASEFMTVMGQNPATRTVMKEYVNQNMLDTVISSKTGEITEGALTKWLTNHRLALKKLGMADDFNTLAKAREQVDKALINKAAFDKSVASKVLGADVNNIISYIFSRGPKGKTASTLMDILKDPNSPKEAYEKLLNKATGQARADLEKVSKFIHSDGVETIVKDQPAMVIHKNKAYRGQTHPSIINRIENEGVRIDYDNILEGFITNRGNFMTRSESYTLYGVDHTYDLKYLLSMEAFDTSLAKHLMVKTKGNKQAVAGLQNAMVDEMLAEVPLEGEIGKLLTSKQMTAKLQKYDAAIKVVFKGAPEKVKAMYQVRQAVKILERGTKIPGGSGIDRAENLITFLARRHGFSKRAVVNIVQAVIGPLKRFSDTQINTLINRALLDPDYAYGLMSAVTKMKQGTAIRLKPGTAEVQALRVPQTYTNILLKAGLMATRDKEE